MSSGPVYVQSVLVTLGTPDETFVFPVTDVQELDSEGTADPLERTRQGPLASGERRDIGSFGNLIEHARRGTQTRCSEGSPMAVKNVTIEVVGIYGSEDLPIGACRRFLVFEENGRLLVQRKP